MMDPFPAAAAVLRRLLRDAAFTGAGAASAVAALGPVVASAAGPDRAARVLRRWADRERRRITRFTGEEVLHPVTEPGDDTTPGEWRWLARHAGTGFVLGVVAVLLPLAALSAAVVPLYWWAVPGDEPVVTLYPITSWALALTSPLLAVGYLLLALLLVPPAARWQAATGRRLLTPPGATGLEQRVAELTASRAAALEAHGAELRRIERDLHDGTQNRLVAVAMHLGIVERALRRDPASALPLVLRAQDAATDALAGLREVVRAIYPPVLAERGLDGAVAGLVAACPVPCTLTASALRRAPTAVESAAYFVIAEALTNVAKHSGASHASVHLACDSTLVVEVRDDGRGGADEGAGSGLAGIRRRVEAFDGTALLTSPPGGPTLLRVELPCGS
ncbi:signal transduction histidine kinase [Saccharothrix longispora]|uniref:histidine kinase n=2 Tax=Saccharothrix longispora TaxID=33920 RepID=A0ABU1PWW1_9PSEU|nr:signal transduction histidine kinase [Saccharothrix longispora]